MQIIAGHMGDLSAGKNLIEKSKMLYDLCGVNKFQDLFRKTTDELKALDKKLSDYKTETKSRETMIDSKPKKPSFRLEDL